MNSALLLMHQQSSPLKRKTIISVIFRQETTDSFPPVATLKAGVLDTLFISKIGLLEVAAIGVADSSLIAQNFGARNMKRKASAKKNGKNFRRSDN